MNFCDVCDNMLYLKISPKDRGESVLNFCRNCGCEKEIPLTQCLSRRILKKKDVAIELNEYTKFDPSLPRIQKQCPSCPNKDDIIYVRYNEDDLSYAYLCPSCNNTWKN